MVRDGTCSTFFTLPPLPCPSSCKSLRSSSRKSYLTSAFRSRLARVFDSVVWYVMRFALAPVAGADEGAGATAIKLSTADDDSPAAGVSGATLGLRTIGGGRFFPPPTLDFAGAWRIGRGSGSDGGGGAAETSSWRALKLRFERRRFMMVRREKDCGSWKRREWQGQDQSSRVEYYISGTNNHYF